MEACASLSSNRGTSALFDEADDVLVFGDGCVQGHAPQRDVGLQDRFDVGIIDDDVVAILDIGQADTLPRHVTWHEQLLPDLFFDQAYIAEPFIQQLELLGISFLHRARPPLDPETPKGRWFFRPPALQSQKRASLSGGSNPFPPRRGRDGKPVWLDFLDLGRRVDTSAIELINFRHGSLVAFTCSAIESTELFEFVLCHGGRKRRLPLGPLAQPGLSGSLYRLRRHANDRSRLLMPVFMGLMQSHFDLLSRHLLHSIRSPGFP